MSTYKLLIDGKLVDGSSTLDVINPATEEVLARCPRASQEQAEQAVQAAHKAFGAWRRVPLEERRAMILKLADAVNKNAAEIAKIMTQEQGKPLAEATAEMAYSEGFIRHLASLDLKPVVLEDSAGRLIEMQRKPLGVVAAITPWNFPMLIAAFKLAPALLAGNTVIIKPAPTTPLTALKLGELCQQIFPPGVVNVIVDKNDLGAFLSAHPLISKVSFTGSTETGKKVMASAAGTLKRLTLELGGNDAAIVLDDVDPKQIAAGLFATAFMNCGQVCLAIKRLYVQEKVYDQVCDEMAKLADAAKVGDGLTDGIEIGPLQNSMQYEKFKSFLDDGRKNGRIIAGGQVLEGRGYFARPTIVRDIAEGTRLVDEEQFGPILPIIKFKTEDEVLARSNASSYGLGGSVWSGDRARARRVAEGMESGTVWINKHLDFGPGIPFAGAKQSGLGVEFAQEGLEEFTQLQVINAAK